MIVAEAKAALEGFLKPRRIDLGRSPVGDIARACLDFYAEVPAADVVPLEEDGDMFLFQWGRSRWDKRPEDFNIDFTRQFVIATADDDHPDDPEIEYFQLHCTLWLPAGPFSSIANGHIWLYRPAGAAEFLETLEAHPVMLEAGNHRQVAYEIVLDQV